ncbi:hypothetical protein PUN28_011199 [Cardiocondyla obscurior]|uniref:Uncharacterized protein n=1 Tax=Cardiocondyla obscurior TaxID=286306 RepID=A0AAW2FN69_9HYME
MEFFLSPFDRPRFRCVEKFANPGGRPREREREYLFYANSATHMANAFADEYRIQITEKRFLLHATHRRKKGNIFLRTPTLIYYKITRKFYLYLIRNILINLCKF